jgi:hypothetical protein
MDPTDLDAIISELIFLRQWVAANTRRLDDLESNAFTLEETEEVILVTVPKKDAPSHR